MSQDSAATTIIAGKKSSAPADAVLHYPAQTQRTPHATQVGKHLAPNGTSKSWAVSAGEFLVIVVVSVACGTLYHQLRYDVIGTLSTFLATGILTGTLYCAGMRAAAEFWVTRLNVISSAFMVWIAIFALMSFVAFSLKVEQGLSRAIILSFFFFGLPAAIATRLYLPPALARLRLVGAQQIPIVLGTERGAYAEQVASLLRFAGHSAVSVLSIDENCSDYQWGVERRNLANKIAALTKQGNCESIYFVAEGFSPERSETLITLLRKFPLGIRLVPSHEVEKFLNFSVHRLGHVHAVELRRTPLNAIQRFAKRGLDFAGALFGIILLAPFLALIGLLIKLDSSGPVFFTQARSGRGGRPFRIIKFRSMKVLEDGTEIVQASRGDSRVTRIGNIIRKTSLDELPQLFNVLVGDMSLVGPRPHAIAHDKLYASLIENYDLRQCVRPGITGWAQVNGYRGETATPELMRARIELDLWYATNTSILLDIVILVRTAFIVFFQSRAY
jgi:Undecaprenyl-phosphate glucose phosphotransferase